MKNDATEVPALLPSIQHFGYQRWEKSSVAKGWKKILARGRMIFFNTTDPVTGKKLTILTGPTHAGKTNSLLKWSENKKDVFGILTPMVNGQRVFMDAQTREQFNMEATEREDQVMVTGRYIYSKKSFNKAQQIIREANKQRGWIIIDEVGPMELEGKGLSAMIKEVLLNQKDGQNILLVVRNGLVDKAKTYFQINEASVINQLP